VVTFSDTNEHKPSTTPFKRALALLKIMPSEVLYVGDNPARDIIGAKRAGLATCLAEYGAIDLSEEENVADYTLKRFHDIGKVLAEME